MLWEQCEARSNSWCRKRRWIILSRERYNQNPLTFSSGFPILAIFPPCISSVGRIANGRGQPNTQLGPNPMHIWGLVGWIGLRNWTRSKTGLSYGLYFSIQLDWTRAGPYIMRVYFGFKKRSPIQPKPNHYWSKNPNYINLIHSKYLSRFIEWTLI